MNESLQAPGRRYENARKFAEGHLTRNVDCYRRWRLTIAFLLIFLDSGITRAAEDSNINVKAPFEFELDPAFSAWVRRPGEHLSVFDGISELESCKRRTGANAAAGWVNITSRMRTGSNGSVDETVSPSIYSKLDEISRSLSHEMIFGTIYLGDRNNPFFTHYPEEFQKAHPEAYMQDANGQQIRVQQNPISGLQSAVPAVDDPTISRLATELIRDGATLLRDNRFITSWVIGTEEAYPDYFGLPIGDFRPASLKHFQKYLAKQGWTLEGTPRDILQGKPTPFQSAWYLFREQAMADRAAVGMRDFLAVDSTRPIFYPTHGHPFSELKRRGLGLSPTLLLGACDGLEMGHITIDDDREGLNLLFLTTFTSMGAPVIVPRLGNKTLDPEARGGGLSFTPQMLRRLVYECLGMGVWHIGPIHWRSKLGDGEWNIKGTPAETECKKVFGEIRDAGPFLDGMSRVQPEIALYVADDTWIRGWNPRWTGFFQDAIANHCQLALVGDGMISSDLVNRIPVLISIDNTHVAAATTKRLLEYAEAGGAILVSGDLGTNDELGLEIPSSFKESLATMENVVTIPPNTKPKRQLVNSFQTGEGAYHVQQQYTSVDFSKITALIASQAPQATMRPMKLLDPKKGSAIEALTLTDGFSKLCVLINKTGDETVAEIKVPDTDFGFPLAWRILREEQDNSQPLSETGILKVPLEGWGSSLVWIHPAVDINAVKQRIQEADKAISRWEELGASTVALQPILQAAQEYSLTDGLAPKAYCLASRILSSCCLKSTISPTSEGGVRVESVAYDSQGNPATGLAVRLRIVPGSFEWHSFREVEPGVYIATLAASDLPKFYNPEKQKYEAISGRSRVVISAYGDGITGGDMLTHTP